MLLAANVSFVDQKGDPMLVTAASLRSGAVCSAEEYPPMIFRVWAGGPLRSGRTTYCRPRWTCKMRPCSMWPIPACAWSRPHPNRACWWQSLTEFDVSGFFAPHVACDICAGHYLLTLNGGTRRDGYTSNSIQFYIPTGSLLYVGAYSLLYVSACRQLEMN